MASSITFAQAKTRLAGQITYNGTVDEAIQEAVDRAYEMGRWQGMTLEVKLTESDYVLFEDPPQVRVNFPMSSYNGAVGFRTVNGGMGIVDQVALFRDGIAAGDKSVIDLGEVTVESVLYHQYRLPLNISTAPSYDIWVLLKLVSPTLSDSDIVPIKNYGALKQAVLAVCYENVNDESRAEVCWSKFEEAMEKGQRQFQGPQQRHISVQNNMRRRPTQFQ